LSIRGTVLAVGRSRRELLGGLRRPLGDLADEELAEDRERLMERLKADLIELSLGVFIGARSEPDAGELRPEPKEAPPRQPRELLLARPKVRVDLIEIDREVDLLLARVAIVEAKIARVRGEGAEDPLIEPVRRE